MYNTIVDTNKTYTSEITIKKSRFIATLSHFDNQEELKKAIDDTRKAHPKARHVVHAAVFGEKSDVFSMSDDREPKYTAGKPMLNILVGSGLKNVGVITVRYFGGTLLGRGGLQKAYSDVCKAVVNEAKES